MRPRLWARRSAGIAVLTAVIGCGGSGGASSSPASSAPKTPPPGHVYVGGSNGYGDSTMAFTPSNITITAGSTVTWDFLEGPHNVTSGTPGAPDGAFDSGAAQSSGTFVHTFPTAGTFKYYCSVHGAMMTGTVTVN